MSSFSELIRNSNNNNKRNDSFYVKFFNFPEDVSNYLGKQIKRFNRPTISFETSTMSFRNSKVSRSGKLDLPQFTMTFNDDSTGIVSMLLHAQIMRQLKMQPNIFGQTNQGFDLHDDRFDLEVVMWGETKSVTDSFRLRRCYITNIDYGDLTVDDDTDSEITVSVVYDNYDVKIFDRYHSLIQRD